MPNQNYAKMRSAILGVVKISRVGTANSLYKFSINTKTKTFFVLIQTSSYKKALEEAERKELAL